MTLYLFLLNNVCILVALLHARKTNGSMLLAGVLGYSLGLIYILWIFREPIKEIFQSEGVEK